MKDWTWPAVTVFAIMVAGIVTMFCFSSDQATRNHLLVLVDAIVPFVIGAAAGGATGFLRGKGLI